MFKKTFLVVIFFSQYVFGQNNCTYDSIGKTYCAPPHGSAIQSLSGVVCALGKCVQDNLGYIKCSSKQGGGAITDSLGRPQCIGGCVNPSKDLCIEMKGEERK